MPRYYLGFGDFEDYFYAYISATEWGAVPRILKGDKMRVSRSVHAHLRTFNTLQSQPHELQLLPTSSYAWDHVINRWKSDCANQLRITMTRPCLTPFRERSWLGNNLRLQLFLMVAVLHEGWVIRLHKRGMMYKISLPKRSCRSVLGLSGETPDPIVSR